MSRLPLLDLDTTTGPAGDALAAVQKSLGAVPKHDQGHCAQPALLNGYLGLSAALAAGTFRLAMREQVALTVSEQNACSYCLSAHTFVARGSRRDRIDMGSVPIAEHVLVCGISSPTPTYL